MGIPEGARQLIVQRDIRVLALDTLRIASEVAGRPELRQRMQGIVLLGVFLRVTPFRQQRGLDEDAVFSAVERSQTCSKFSVSLLLTFPGTKSTVVPP